MQDSWTHGFDIAFLRTRKFTGKQVHAEGDVQVIQSVRNNDRFREQQPKGRDLDAEVTNAEAKSAKEQAITTQQNEKKQMTFLLLKKNAATPVSHNGQCLGQG